jgi:hypothetical protein
MLWPMYMGSPLIPPTFLALGALVHGCRPVREALRSAGWKCALFVLLVASLTVPWRPHALAGPSRIAVELAIALAAVGALTLPVRIAPSGLAVAALAPLVLVNYAVAPAADRYAVPAACETGADMLRLFRDADRLTGRIDPTLRTRYWFSEREVLREAGCPDFDYGAAFHSFVATRGWLGNLWPGFPMKELPQISGKDLETLADVRFLASLSSEASRFDEFQQRLRTLGLAPEPVGLYEMRRGRLVFYIGMLQLSPTGAAALR